ncbi:hypothetical protein EDD85DRAFT_797760 [Armillaria nabsnona]|nr:hypothetical protein EDD85DRAFT_797760 [Armillaria nabsnona]
MVTWHVFKSHGHKYTLSSAVRDTGAIAIGNITQAVISATALKGKDRTYSLQAAQLLQQRSKSDHDRSRLSGKAVIVIGSRLNEEGREPGLGEGIWYELDLKDPRSAKELADRFIAREENLISWDTGLWKYSSAECG